jgi:DNA-binding MarR family transcriptional regulator
MGGYVAPDLDRHLGFLLHDAARLMRKRFDRRARAIGLSRAQWSVLAHLSRAEGIHQGGLAEILEVEPISLARMIDRLEAAGLVERRSDPGDRRLKRLFLLPPAEPLLERMRALGVELREEALAGLPPAERELLVDALLRMKGNLLGLEPSDDSADELLHA